MFVIAVLVIFAFVTRKKYPLIFFGVLWFFIGHILESSFIPLDLYFEHRNYLPMVGLLLVLGYYLMVLGSRFSNWGAVFGVAVILLLANSFFTLLVTKTWEDPNRLYYTWTTQHPGSLRAQRMYAENLDDIGLPSRARNAFDAAYEQHPYDLSLLLAQQSLYCRKRIPQGPIMDDVLKALPNARFTDGYLYYLNELIPAVADQRCDIGTSEQMHQLLWGLQEVPSFKSRHQYLAHLYNMHADLYIREGRLEATMDLLEKIFQIQPTVDIAMKQVIILTSAGLFKEARVKLQLAKEIDKNRPVFRPSRKDELQILKDALDAA